MPQSHVFRLPQRQMKWYQLFFISQLLVMNFSFARNDNFLGALFFRLFWLGPIAGSVFWLKRAKDFELRIAVGETIEFKTATGVTSFSVHDPDLKVTWSIQPDRVLLESASGKSRIDFGEYHQRDRDVIRALVSEFVAQGRQDGWAEYQMHEATCYERTYRQTQRVRRFAFPVLFGAGSVLGVAAVLFSQPHLVIVAVVNLWVGLSASSNAKRWLADNPVPK